MIHDAVIVGAGLSGLVCARRLVDAGARVRVVEARTRLGGRLASAQLAGATIDLGGQWMSAGQPRLAALAAELGVASFPQWRTGRPRLDEPGGVFAQLVTAVAQWRAVRRIDRLARGVCVDAVARTPDAGALDARSLADWLSTVANPVVRARLGMHAELVFAAAAEDLSLLAYLARLRATGGFAPPGPELPGGGREHRFVGGAHELAARLGAGLGDAIRLGEPITAIEPDGTALIVRGASDHRARRVVLAVPPVLAARIAVELGPPARRLLDAARMGSVVKCFAAYDRPFWRDDGWSGEAYLPGGTVRAIVDISGHAAGAPGVLLAFVVGRAADGWRDRDPASRRAEVIATLVQQFGDPARDALDDAEVDWGVDPWSAGCVATTAPGALAAGATWREPHDRIHLAGTESSVAWPGYMEGAIEAGDRAAGEVILALAGAACAPGPSAL